MPGSKFPIPDKKTIDENLEKYTNEDDRWKSGWSAHLSEISNRLIKEEPDFFQYISKVAHREAKGNDEVYISCLRSMIGMYSLLEEQYNKDRADKDAVDNMQDGGST